MWNIDEFLSGLNIDLDRLRDVFTMTRKPR